MNATTKTTTEQAKRERLAAEYREAAADWRAQGNERAAAECERRAAAAEVGER